MRIGTRGSKLARWQADHVAARLRAAGREVEIVVIRTQGDRVLDVPLSAIGDPGLFTKELDEALLDGRIDVAVHSLKDLPTVLPEGLRIAAVSARAEPWDAFVAHPAYDGTLADLPPGAVIATSSLRRQAQLRAWRPDLRTVSVRGNVPTRLAALADSGVPGDGGWHGVILAAAGLQRLGFDDQIRERIAPQIMVPAVGQGALGVVCTEENASASALLSRLLDDDATRTVALAERAFMRRLDGGCQVPIGGYARLETGSTFTIEGVVASIDGRQVFRGEQTGTPSQAVTLAQALADELLARGAREVLNAIRADVA
ncbi:MAG: hydroxymethylbilane synthase [Bacteroidota bacterium]